MSTEIWSFKYEPKTLNGMVLNKDIRPKLQKAIKEVPNLLLYGMPGVGKGTFTNILLKETGYDYLWINASDEGKVDDIKSKVKSFATSLGITPLKIVVLNEADALSFTAGSGGSSAQEILRQLMEDVHKVTRFIFLANYERNIIKELKSRCQIININNPPGTEIFRFAMNVLSREKIKFKKETVLSIVKKCHPDIRSTILALQENSVNGKLIGDRISGDEELHGVILRQIVTGDIEGVRKNLRSNAIDYTSLYKFLYENAGEFKSPGDAIIEIGDHLVNDNIVAIKEINFMHMVMKMMKERIA